AESLRVRLELVGRDAAIQHLGLLVDAEDRAFIQLLEDVAETQYDHLVADDQHPTVAIMEVDRAEHRAKAQDHVGPALAARRPVVEFAEPAAVGRFFREFVANAGSGPPSEDVEL